jgi:hypothetical protein
MEDLKFAVAENELMGIRSSTQTNLIRLLSAIFPNEDNNRSINYFFRTKFKADSGIGENDSIVSFNDTTKFPLFFIQDNSLLSLPFAVFKYLGVLAAEKDNTRFVEAIEKFNKASGESVKIDTSISPRDFFTGTVTNGVRTDPEFYKMLKVLYAEPALDLLVDLISDTFSTGSKNLKDPLKSISRLMSKKDLSDYKKANALKDTLAANTVAQRERSEQYLSKLSTNLATDRQLHFGLKKTSGPLASANDINNFINNNINLGKDLIEVTVVDKKTKKEFRLPIVPTYVVVIDDAVFIRGWRWHNNQMIKQTSKIKIGESVEFFKFVSASKPKIYEKEI